MEQVIYVQKMDLINAAKAYGSQNTSWNDGLGREQVGTIAAQRLCYDAGYYEKHSSISDSSAIASFWSPRLSWVSGL